MAWIKSGLTMGWPKDPTFGYVVGVCEEHELDAPTEHMGASVRLSWEEAVVWEVMTA